MPIYEYLCEACGRKIEVFGQTTSQAQPPASCSCGKDHAYSRLFSTFAAHGSTSNGSDVPDCCAQGNCGNHAAGCGCCH